AGWLVERPDLRVFPAVLLDGDPPGILALAPQVPDHPEPKGHVRCRVDPEPHLLQGEFRREAPVEAGRGQAPDRALRCLLERLQREETGKFGEVPRTLPRRLLAL